METMDLSFLRDIMEQFGVTASIVVEPVIVNDHDAHVAAFEAYWTQLNLQADALMARRRR